MNEKYMKDQEKVQKLMIQIGDTIQPLLYENEVCVCCMALTRVLSSFVISTTEDLEEFMGIIDIIVKNLYEGADIGAPFWEMNKNIKEKQ